MLRFLTSETTVDELNHYRIEAQEEDHSWLCNVAKLDHSWKTFYAFIGVVGFEQNSLAGEANACLDAVAWYMIVVGALYTVPGAMCLQRYHDNLVSDVDKIVQDSKTAIRGG